VPSLDPENKVSKVRFPVGHRVEVRLAVTVEDTVEGYG